MFRAFIILALFYCVDGTVMPYCAPPPTCMTPPPPTTRCTPPPTTRCTPPPTTRCTPPPTTRCTPPPTTRCTPPPTTKCPTVRPTCPGPNEVYVDCKDPCPETCESIYSAIKVACMPPYPCPPGCNCIPGYVRDKNNKCIRKEDCPKPLTCNANEVLNPSPKPCVPGEMTTCAEYVSGVANPCDPRAPVPCEPRCDCAPGYLRNSQGVCVPKDNCCDDPNEIPVDCPDPCPLTCANMLTKFNTPCAKMCIKRGCTCREGYARDANGKCIPLNQCPNPCMNTEVLNLSPKACVPGDMTTCTEYTSGVPNACDPTAPPPRGPRCDCAPGYLKNNQGVCVKQENCCEDPNAIPVDCPDPCPLSCANMLTKYKFPCGRMCIKRGCTCKDGYALDASGKCIPLNQCPNPCKNTEVLNLTPRPCVPGEMTTCNEYTSGVANSCDPNAPLPPGPSCSCAPGYYRDENNECIKKDDCCGINASIVDYPDPCPLTCGNILTKNSIACTRPARSRGCACNDGYARDANYTCIRLEDCPNPCTGMNEILNPCPGYCTFEDDCGSVVLGLIRDCAAPPPDYKCAPRCECRRNLVRIGTECVSAEQCCKDPNEELVDCPSPCEETCEGKPAADCQLSPCFKKGCRCKAGFVRDYKGNCVTKDKCPSCNNPYEVFMSCGTACPPTCANRNPICTKNCVAGCFCKPGYIRKCDNGPCILISDCPIDCTGQNEEYNECSYGDPTCDSPNPITVGTCKKGCFCIRGFVRDSNGKCIDPKTCPKKCTGENEVYNDCGTCDPSCKNRNPICAQVCRPGCYCRDGYVRNDMGKCILPQNCPPEVTTTTKPPCTTTTKPPCTTTTKPPCTTTTKPPCTTTTKSPCITTKPTCAPTKPIVTCPTRTPPIKDPLPPVPIPKPYPIPRPGPIPCPMPGPMPVPMPAPMPAPMPVCNK